jgi:hypothetical protein
MRLDVSGGGKDSTGDGIEGLVGGMMMIVGNRQTRLLGGVDRGSDSNTADTGGEDFEALGKNDGSRAVQLCTIVPQSVDPLWFLKDNVTCCGMKLSSIKYRMEHTRRVDEMIGDKSSKRKEKQE